MNVQVLVSISENLCVIQTESQHVQDEGITDALWLEGPQKIFVQSKVAPNSHQGAQGFDRLGAEHLLG